MRRELLDAKAALSAALAFVEAAEAGVAKGKMTTSSQALDRASAAIRTAQGWVNVVRVELRDALDGGRE